MASRNFLGNSGNLILGMLHLRSSHRLSQHAMYTQLISGVQMDLRMDRKSIWKE
jgi:hypothetical protein